MQNEIKLFNNKKGFSGSGIVIIILFIFIGIGITLPFVNEAFDVEGSIYDTENIGNKLIEDKLADVPEITVGEISVSVVKMFFWTFGDLPFWLDAIFLVLRIMLLLILIKAFTPWL